MSIHFRLNIIMKYAIMCATKTVHSYTALCYMYYDIIQLIQEKNTIIKQVILKMIKLHCHQITANRSSHSKQ